MKHSYEFRYTLRHFLTIFSVVQLENDKYLFKDYFINSKTKTRQSQLAQPDIHKSACIFIPYIIHIIWSRNAYL